MVNTILYEWITKKNITLDSDNLGGLISSGSQNNFEIVTWESTLPKFLATEKLPQKERIVFLPSFFRGDLLNFRGLVLQEQGGSALEFLKFLPPKSQSFYCSDSEPS